MELYFLLEPGKMAEKSQGSDGGLHPSQHTLWWICGWVGGEYELEASSPSSQVQLDWEAIITHHFLISHYQNL